MSTGSLNVYVITAYGRAVPLDPVHASLIRAHLHDPVALQVIAWAICQPNRSPFATDAEIVVQKGETLADAAERASLTWSPRWLLDAGFKASDAAGAEMSATDAATEPGPITWAPSLRLARVDDQTPDSAASGSQRRARRLAGELAVLSLWERARSDQRLPDIRPVDDISGNTRGSTFRDFLLEVLQGSMPAGWQVRHEVPLTEIRGLHMRRNVGGRSSDIVVTDEGNRLVAVISSKWTWRSDRGTEAAQMVPLRMYRPDVPYSLVTAEFARVKVIARESIEDSVFHLAPNWAGAWYGVVQRANPAVELPSLDDLEHEGRLVAESMGLQGLHELVRALTASGTIL